MKSFCDDFFSIGVDMVWVWYWCGSDMLRWCCVDAATVCQDQDQSLVKCPHCCWVTLDHPFNWLEGCCSVLTPQKQCEKVNHLSFKVFWATETDLQVGGGEIISWGLNLWTEMVTNHSCFDLFTFVNISLRKEACWCLIDNLNLFLSFSATAQSRQSTQCAQSRQLIF